MLDTARIQVEQTRGMFISLACVLLGFGVLMVHSASITSWPTEFEQVYLSKHLAFLAVGLIVASVCASLSVRFWYRSSVWLFIATMVLLLLVLVPEIGTEVNGARRWFRYGRLSFQPSELAKITLPLFVCRLIHEIRPRLDEWIAGGVVILLPAAVVVSLVMMEPDFGGAVFLAGGCGVALLIGGWPLRNFVVSIALAVPALGYLIAGRAYQLKRITGFLTTWSNLDAAPYQLKQSLVTLGAGGLFGVGLGKGWQKLSFLPEANTDFVFAVVGEELGLVGTLALMGLWAGLFMTGVKLLSHLDRNSYAWMAGFTLLAQLAFQAALNMAVATALVPPKGIPFPLLSYGGSNLVVSVVSLGIIVGLSRSGQDNGLPYSTPELGDAN